MRKLMWFALGATVICWAAALWTAAVNQPCWMVLLVGLSVLLLILGRKREKIRPVFLAVLGAAVGLLWFSLWQNWRLTPVKALDGQIRSLAVTIRDYSRRYDREDSVQVRAEGIVRLEGQTYPVYLYLRDVEALAPGDGIYGDFSVSSTLMEDYRDSSYYSGRGIYLTLSQRDTIHITKARNVPARFFPAVLRRQIRQILEAVFPPDCAGFARALLLGDGEGLDYQTNTVLKVSGIRHIIAVSGLHISILYGMISLLTFRRRFLTAAVSMPVPLLFAAVAGFTPSVTRACIMVWMMLLAKVFERDYDSLTALAVAVLAMVLWNPLAVTSVSLQLSAGSVAGIVLFSPSIQGWLEKRLPGKSRLGKKLRRFVCVGISVALGAMMFVTPLSAWYFGMVSLIGVVTNLLTLWVVTILFNLLIVLCLIYGLLPGVSAVLAWFGSWLIRYVLAAAKCLAAFPLAAVYLRNGYTLLWLGFCYGLGVLILTKKAPGVKRVLCCGCIGLCLALLLSWTEPLTENVRITMLDVGQGQSILLQSQGKAFLVDCGGDDEGTTADIVAGELLSQGIFRLDGVILTHYDRDHAGGLANLLTRVDTDLLILPDTRGGFSLPETTGRVLYVWEDLELTFGSAVLRIYGPVYSGCDNENSLGILFDTEKCDILITGDRSGFGERMLLRGRTLPDVDILVAGHHGAEDAATDALMNAAKPETVLISVGQGNIYGHPSPALLSRLGEYGCRVYRTDLHGTITIRR